MRLPWIACFVALAACGKDEETTTDTTTDTTDTTEPTPPTPFEAFDEVDLANIDAVHDLSSLSALGMVERYRVVVGAFSNSDPACPVVEDDGAGHLVATGGCTDTSGVVWTGTLDYLATKTSVLATLTGFGFSFEGECYGSPITLQQTIDGTIALDYGGGVLAYDLQGVWPHANILTCEITDANFIMDYDLQFQSVGKESLYSGSGRYADDVYGRVDVQTIGQLEDTCFTEADSGVTLLTTSEHQVAITYDGAIDCDDPGTATWSLDGAPQGEILGVECSSTPGAAGWLALAPLAALIRRRR
jgi:hypothetical protein